MRHRCRGNHQWRSKDRRYSTRTLYCDVESVVPAISVQASISSIKESRCSKCLVYKDKDSAI